MLAIALCTFVSESQILPTSLTSVKLFYNILELSNTVVHIGVLFILLLPPTDALDYELK